jgi:hypothetical protein
MLTGAFAQSIVDTFTPVRDSLQNEDKKHERRALRAAFVMLDVHDCGCLTWDVFRLLLKVRSPPWARGRKA